METFRMTIRFVLPPSIRIRGGALTNDGQVACVFQIKYPSSPQFTAFNLTCSWRGICVCVCVRWTPLWGTSVTNKISIILIVMVVIMVVEVVQILRIKIKLIGLLLGTPDYVGISSIVAGINTQHWRIIRVAHCIRSGLPQTFLSALCIPSDGPMWLTHSRCDRTRKHTWLYIKCI